MISIFLSTCVLAALTVAVHATGIAVLLRGLLRLHPQPTGVWPVARLLLRMIWWLVLVLSRGARNESPPERSRSHVPPGGTADYWPSQPAGMFKHSSRYK